MKLISLVSAALVLASFAFTGCTFERAAEGVPGKDGTAGQQGAPGADGKDGDKGDPGQDGTDGQDAEPCSGPPPGTFEIQKYENQAEEYFASCMIYALAGKTECDKGQDPDTCALDFMNKEGECQYYRAIRINTATMYVCGIEVFQLDDATQTATFKNGIDTDSDGVDDSWEVFMGLNPCEKFSYGTCSPADGDWDFDGDGLLNKDDPAPLCNPAIGPNYQSDCI